jgi:hypothetical protein
MGTQSYLSLHVLTTLPCQRTGAMRSPSALLLQESFFSLSRFIFPTRLLLLCERYLRYFCPHVPPHLSFTKQPNPRKRAEKRESSRTLSVLSDDSQRKVKGALTSTTPTSNRCLCLTRKNKLAQLGLTPDHRRSMETGDVLYNGGRGGLCFEGLS